MRVAGCALSLRHLCDDVIAAIRVDDQCALGAAEEPLGCLATPIAGEDVRDIVIAVLVGCDEGPDRAVLRFASAVLLHQQARLVGADDRASADLIEESLPQRLRQLARAVQEIVHRRASERKAATSEVLLEAIEWQVVRTLCDRQVCEQRRAVPTLLDDLGRARCAFVELGPDL